MFDKTHLARCYVPEQLNFSFEKKARSVLVNSIRYPTHPKMTTIPTYPTEKKIYPILKTLSCIIYHAVLWFTVILILYIYYYCVQITAFHETGHTRYFANYVHLEDTIDANSEETRTEK